MATAQDIVRILQAAGGFIPDVDSTEYYVVLEESNELSERHWFGSQLASETLIASGIRTDSPAVYAVHDDIRSVFCVGEDNALRAFKLLGDEWQDFPLTGIGNILVHPSSRLSGCVVGNDNLVFFEDFKYQIRGIRVKEDGSWRFLRSLPVKSVPGNPHFAQVRDGVVYLSYLNQDGYIHHMSMEIASNSYRDARLPGANFSNTLVANLFVGVQDKAVSQLQNESRNEPRNGPELCLLALTKKNKEEEPDELVCVDGTGKRTLLGKIVDDMFRWISDKEHTGPAIKSAAGAVTNATGKPKPKKRR